MRTSFLFLFLLSTSFVRAQSSKELLRLNQLMDQWHVYAAKADFQQYFHATTEDFIFLGTAPGERWDKPAFQTFCQMHLSL